MGVEDRFGPNGAVMDGMSDEVRAEYERASRFDVSLSDCIPNLIAILAAPFAMQSDAVRDLGPAAGASLVVLSLLLGVAETRRVRAAHPGDWRGRLRWSRADACGRLVHVAGTVLMVIGIAAALSSLFKG